MEEHFACPICYEQFDSSKFIPKMLVCGHTICSFCLTRLILSNQNQSEPKCPLDNIRQPKNLENFPVNLPLQKLIEVKKQSQPEYCLQHKNEFNFICLTDKQKICDLCLEAHYDKHHEIKNIKTIKKEAFDGIKVVEGLLSEINTFHERFEKEVEKVNSTILSEVNKKFQRLHIILQEKEAEFMMEIKSSRNRINKKFPSNSKYVANLYTIKSNLEKIIKQKTFDLEGFPFSIPKEIESYKARFNFEENQRKIQEKFEYLKSELDTCFGKQEEILSNIQVPQNIFNDLISLFIEDSKDLNGNNDSKGDKNLFIKSHFRIECSNESLKISNDYQVPTDSTLDLAAINKIQQIILMFNKTMSYEDTQALGYILKRLKNPTELFIKFNSGTINQDIYKLLANSPNNFSTVALNIEDYETQQEDEAVSILKGIITQTSNLKKLFVNFTKTSLQMSCIPTILNKETINPSVLEVIDLDFRDTDIIDENLTSVFIPMPNLTQIGLYLLNTEITDQSLKLCGQITFASTKSLRDVTIILENTNVTDAGVESLLMNLRNLKKIRLGFHNTKITDKTVFLLSHHTLKNREFLEDFSLNLKNTQITDQSCLHLFKAMRNLKSFFINLSNTNITDQTIMTFTHNVLVSMPNVESLKVWFNNTNITDKAVWPLLANIGNVKNLTLGLVATKISDKSMGMFLKEKLPMKKDLKELDIRVNNTNLSPEILQEIAIFMDKVNNQQKM